VILFTNLRPFVASITDLFIIVVMDHRSVTSNFLILCFVLLGVGCTPQCERTRFESANPLLSPMIEFKIDDLEQGHGPALKEGDIISVYYRGWVYDDSRPDKKGAIIGDNYSNKSPQHIKFGEDELINGWQDGLAGIRAGGKRRLFIPSSMAYGDQGAAPTIPQGAHLIYEIEVVSITHEDPSE